MTKLLISILCISSFWLGVDAQEKPTLIPLALKGDLAKKYSFQFSSIVITNDSIILVAEKCGKIYILNKKNLDIISIKEDLPKDKIESIEGVTLFTYAGAIKMVIDWQTVIPSQEINY